MLIVSTVCVLFVNFVLKSKEETNLSLSAKASNLVIMILLAAIGGGYSNPVVYKDLQNPIVSNSFWYVFYTYTNNEKVDKKLEYPEEAVSYLQSHLTKDHTLDKNSFISFRSKTTCSKSTNKDLASGLCLERPNVLLILMESYRGDDVGVLGSNLKITPAFDELSKEGILFTNFYANGFQDKAWFSG